MDEIELRKHFEVVDVVRLSDHDGIDGILGAVEPGTDWTCNHCGSTLGSRGAAAEHLREQHPARLASASGSLRS
jgi:hypothetical protein